MKLPIVLSMGAVLFGSAQSLASPLSDLAARMKTGEWSELVTANTAVFLKTGGSSDTIFGYSESMRLDPVARRAYYLGSDHGGPSFNEAYRFVAYDEATNA